MNFYKVLCYNAWYLFYINFFAIIFRFKIFSTSHTPPMLVFVSNLYVYSFDGSLKILVVMCKCAFASLHDRICVNPLSPTPCNVNPQSPPQLAQSLPAPSSYLSQHHTPPSPLKVPYFPIRYPPPLPPHIPEFHCHKQLLT